MKKLLSLLSVLTISGSAVPTTIAASPYQKEENNEINYSQANNLENLNRSKREQEEFFLDTLGIRGDVSTDGTTRFTQLANYWCGPASVEWILRHFRLNMNSELSRINNDRQHRYVNFQHYLADLMRTHNVENLNQSIGTNPANLVNVINSFINNNNLNNRRQYGLTELQPVYNDYSQFYNIVSSSLRNNMPVIFGFTGVMPGEIHNHNHFVVITGFSGDNSSLETIDYTYIDPGYGRFRHFNASWLDEAIRNNSGFLIHYNQREIGNNRNNNHNCSTTVGTSAGVGAGSGAIAGAVAGSAIPVIGTLIGAAIGAAAGASIGTGVGINVCVSK